MPISPPTIGLSFGSFGDIVAVLQLAWELRAALDESSGASAELRALVGDVDAFTRALQDVQANIERRRQNLRPDVVNGIAAALSRCRGVLSAVQQRIARARGQTSSSGWHKYWGTAAWSILGGKKDVEALRARLSEQLGVMQLYLSLSEANSQERVQDVLVENATTLQRIYDVVQDIQLRFDVGVGAPGFQFYDHDTRRFYLPIARTSLQRLREVCDALRGVDADDMISFMTKYEGITEDDFRHLSVISTQARIPINLGDRRCAFKAYASAYFFREAAFGEWQVLLGSTHVPYPHLDGVLKTLLERNHTVGVDCNCPVPCGTRYRDDVDVMIGRIEMQKAYTQVASLLFEHLQPDELDPGWLDSLLTAFTDCPDPEHLRLTIPTILSRQRLSPGDMVDLITKAPKYRKPAHSLACLWGQQMITFVADGAALYESLTGHALRFSDQTLSNQVRVPDWGHLWNNGTDELGYAIPSLAIT